MGRAWPVLLALAALLPACRSAYYAAWDKLGREKRDLLKARIADVRQDQDRAQGEFQDALTRLKSLYGFQGGDLEKIYEKLNGDYQRCAGRAQQVREQVAEMDHVARDLFREWEREIGQMGDAGLKARSRARLDDTRTRFARLSDAMHRSARSMDRPLERLRDQVLFLKHNLNAEAMGSLRAERDRIDDEIGRLLEDLNASTAEADRFLATLVD